MENCKHSSTYIHRLEGGLFIKSTLKPPKRPLNKTGNLLAQLGLFSFFQQTINIEWKIANPTRSKTAWAWDWVFTRLQNDPFPLPVDPRSQGSTKRSPSINLHATNFFRLALFSQPSERNSKRLQFCALKSLTCYLWRFYCIC